MALPNRISRHNIKSNGYRYGEYHFTLDQTQVLDLLMGDNLYEDPFVFVRELAQNAIDTSRHRRYLEHSRGNNDFEPESIRVTEWLDRDGYRWVRYDDYGMGMDEVIIRNYLLTVGSSYYKTAQFKADLLRAKKGGTIDFVPISRFGIGLLSCFIIGDRVEINTQHQRPDGSRSKPVRLSLNGLHGFYTLQTPELPPAPMPGPDGGEAGYRTEFGTSIAVRIDPRKEKNLTLLRSVLGRYISCPPVPIIFEGERIGRDPAVLVDKPWCDRTLIELLPDEIKRIEKLLGYDFSEPLHIELIPLDLTKHSLTPELKGQILVAVFKPTSEWRRVEEALSKIDGTIGVGVYSTGGKLGLRVSLSINLRSVNLDYSFGEAEIEEILFHDSSDKAEMPEEMIHMLSSIKDRISDAKHESLDYYSGDFEIDAESELASKDLHCSIDLSFKKAPSILRRIIESLDHGRLHWLSHNGVAVPTEIGIGKQGIDLISTEGYHRQRSNIWGIIALADSLRPDVSVSREMLRRISWQAYSHANLAFRRALREQGEEIIRGRVEVFSRSVFSKPLLLEHALQDKLINREGPWAEEKIIPTRSGYKSLKEIIMLLDEGVQVELSDSQWSGFIGSCAMVLVQIGLNITVSFKARERYTPFRVIVQQGKPRPIRDGQKFFPPLTFVPYEDRNWLSVGGQFINLDHPFSQWLIDNALQIAEKYPGILELIRNALLKKQSLEPERTVINNALERLRELDSGIKPPKHIFLKPGDFPDK